MSADPGHVLVIHRWGGTQALYENYLDHSTTRVSYITTEIGSRAIPGGAAAVLVVAATDSFEELSVAASAATEAAGPIDRVVALNEGDLDAAARLRQYLRCSGFGPEQLDRFRDKLVMAGVVADAGIATPQFADAPDIAAVAAFADLHGWPVIVKPRFGTASRGVLRLDSVDDLALLAMSAPEPRIVQTFVGDVIYHVDGLWTGTALGPWRASKYLNTCVEFTIGEVLGSVEEDDADILAAIGEFTTSIAGAMNSEPWVFHLEVFVGARDSGEIRLTFLEAGYRVGGAEIPFVWREVHGIDLMAAAVDVQLGLMPTLVVPDEWQTAGWLLVPPPVQAPCQVEHVSLLNPKIDRSYARVVPSIGYVIPRLGGYEHVGARFRFRGNSSAEVQAAVLSTAQHFRMACKPALPAPRTAETFATSPMSTGASASTHFSPHDEDAIAAGGRK